MHLTKIPEYDMAINLANVDCVIIESAFHPELEGAQYNLRIYMRGTGPITISQRTPVWN